MNRKLEGLLVVDFTAAIAGAYATQCLADNGARVIKIESPKGDLLRSAYPIGETGPSYYFVSANRGKESVCLNLKDPADLQFAKTLVSQADVVVENFRPGVMKRFGLDYADVKKLNPKIVYASISGFGQTGPNNDRACFDLVAQAYSGLMNTNGYTETEPLRVGFSMADVSSAMWGYMAIMTALYARERTGQGDYIDIAMVDGVFAMQMSEVAAWTQLGKLPHRDGNRSDVSAPFGAVKTRDGSIVLAVVGDKLWRDLCEALALPELLKDPQFANAHLRLQNRDEMRAIFKPMFAEKTSKEWLAILEKGGIPTAPINTVQEIVESDQIASRTMIYDVGGIRVAGNPMNFANQERNTDYPRVPEIGEHTETVKSEFKDKRTAQ